ncbi:hypothetical protein ACOSP7_011645 [Xanthoceras sorbifolium]
MCTLCGLVPEIAMHAFWGCQKLKPVRRACGLVAHISGIDKSPFFDFIVLYKNQLKVDEFELLCYVLGRIWFSRNMVVHGLSVLHCDEIVV